MGSDAKSYGAESRGDVYLFNPDALTIVTDTEHPLYDPRVNLPLDERLVASIMQLGVIEPIIVRKNGTTADGTPIIEVVDGRQRVRASLEATKRLRKTSKEPVRVPGIFKRGTGDTLFGVSVATFIRQDDTVLNRAEKMRKYLDMGRTEEDCAVTFGVSLQTVKNYLKLTSLHVDVRSAVADGRVAASTAWKLADFPEAEQPAKLHEALAVASTTNGTRTHADEGTPPTPAPAPRAAALATAVDNAKGPRRGKTRHRTVKTRAQILELRVELTKSRSDAALAAAAILGWVLGDEEALTGYRALAARADKISDEER